MQDKTTFDDLLHVPFDYSKALDVSTRPTSRAFGFSGLDIGTGEFLPGPVAPIEGFIWIRGNKNRERATIDGDVGIVDSVRHSVAVRHSDRLTARVLKGPGEESPDFEDVKVSGYLFAKSPGGNSSVPRQNPAIKRIAQAQFPWEVQKSIKIASSEMPSDAVSLLVQGSDSNDESIVSIGSWQGVLTSPRRNHESKSSLVAELGQDGKYDESRIGSLNDIISVEPDLNADQKIVENWNKSGGLFRLNSVNAYLSSLFGGVLGAGSGARDIHNLGSNYDGDSMGVGHLHLTGPWWHPRGDGFVDVDRTNLIVDKSDGPEWKTFFRPGPNIWAWQTNVPIAASEDETVYLQPSGGLVPPPQPPRGGGKGEDITSRPRDGDEGDQRRAPKGAGPCPPKAGVFGSDPINNPLPLVLATPDPSFVDVAEDRANESESFAGDSFAPSPIGRAEPVERIGAEPCPKPGVIDVSEKSGLIVGGPDKRNIRRQISNYSEIVNQSGSYRGLCESNDIRYLTKAPDEQIQRATAMPTVLRFDVAVEKANGEITYSANDRYANKAASGAKWMMAPNQGLEYVWAGQSMPEADTSSYLGFHDVGISFASPVQESACGENGFVLEFSREDSELALKSIGTQGAFDKNYMVLNRESDSIQFGASKLGFFGADAASKAADYAVTNYTEKRSIDLATATTSDIGDFAATVLGDIISLGLAGGSVT